MKLHRLHHACAIALLAAAPIAAAQTGTTPGPSAVTSSTGNAAATPSTGAPMSTEPAHATKHAAKSHARHAHMGAATMSHADTPYHEALKRCVEGPAAQRDTCIDQAIGQYGRT